MNEKKEKVVKETLFQVITWTVDVILGARS